MARIGGTAFFTVDGKSFSTNGEFDIMIQESIREPETDSNGRVNFTEKPTASKVSGSINVTPDLDPSTIPVMEDATVAVQLNNGKIAVLSEAFYTGEATVTVTDGKMAVEFHGQGRWDSGQ